jgi:acyl carrier protein
MGREAILAEVQNIFRNILDDGELVLTEKSSANNVEGWDSLTHIQLMVTVEKRFKMKFTSQEMMSWKDVGEMIDGIVAKTAK